MSDIRAVVVSLNKRVAGAVEIMDTYLGKEAGVLVSTAVGVLTRFRGRSHDRTIRNSS